MKGETPLQRAPAHVAHVVTLRMLARRLQPIRIGEAGRELPVVIDLALDELDREVLRLKERVRDYPLRIGHARVPCSGSVAGPDRAHDHRRTRMKHLRSRSHRPECPFRPRAAAGSMTGTGS